MVTADDKPELTADKIDIQSPPPLGNKNYNKQPVNTLRAPKINKNYKVDPSTLDFNTREPSDSPKRDEGCFSENLHVKETAQQIINKIVPRGVGIKIHGRDVNDDFQTEGSIISVYCNNKTPSELDRREYSELQEYVSSNFSIIRDNPYETKQLNTKRVKIETEIVNDELADRAFNFYESDDKIIGEL